MKPFKNKKLMSKMMEHILLKRYSDFEIIKHPTESILNSEILSCPTKITFDK